MKEKQKKKGKYGTHYKSPNTHNSIVLLLDILCISSGTKLGEKEALVCLFLSQVSTDKHIWKIKGEEGVSGGIYFLNNNNK